MERLEFDVGQDVVDPSAGLIAIDPDCGFDRYQPGGWIYNILPYVELQSLHDLGAEMSLAAKKPRLTILQETPIVLINCPTRRRPINYPVLLSAAPFNAPNVQFSPKSDYAGNGGDLDPDSAGVGWWQFPRSPIPPATAIRPSPESRM